MKKIFLTILALACCFTAGQSFAANCEMAACATNITLDSGATGRSCNGVLNNCSCSGSAFGGGCTIKFVNAGVGCGSGWAYEGDHLDGRRCCSKTSTCALMQQAEEVEVTSDEDQDLESVYSEDFETSPLVDPFYGWAVTATNVSVLRSPTGGRANAYDAKLDACLFYTDVNSFSSYSGCETACGDTANKNEYCNNNNNAVCIDRCECKYGVGTCNNL